MHIPQDYIDEEKLDDQGYSSYGGYASGGSHRWVNTPTPSTPQDPKNSEESEDSEENETPDPSHGCVHCDEPTYIESETRRNTYNYCEECESVTRHRRL